MPVGKGSIARATNASNGNTIIKEKPVKEKAVKHMPNILTDILLEQITEAPASWKKKGDGLPGMEQLKKSIHKFGLLEPVIVRRLEDNQFQLLSGYKRLQAVRELGFEEITARVFEGMSDSQAKNIFLDLHTKDEGLEKEEKSESKTSESKMSEKHPGEQQKPLVAQGQTENIHELKFKAVTTLSRDLPNYLL